jgi:GT2 family glycosyltransferase
VTPVPAAAETPADIDAVVIGRNEGARLAACLASLAGRVRHVVYVDSGSTDGSSGMAAAAGAEVVALDAAQPFTAARARNAGLARLAARPDPPGYVQFVDGDCTLDPGWLATAGAFLAARPRAAVACGRRRERHPGRSAYNRLADWEWDTPVGPAPACGGDALMRLEAVAGAGGYDGRLIAGEEPELCLRLRAAGWEVWRLDAAMTLHDAALLRFAQFWRRARRAGHAFAEVAHLHRRSPLRIWAAETRRALLWGLALPLATLALAAVHPAGLLLALAWPAQVVRLAGRWGFSRTAWERAALVVAGRLAEAQGAAGFHLARLTGRRRGLIEYR